MPSRIQRTYSSLARALDLLESPGPFTLLDEALGVTGAFNGVSLQRGRLRIEDGTRPRKQHIVAGPRIGITQATDWPLRFYLKDSPWVSGGR